MRLGLVVGCGASVASGLLLAGCGGFATTAGPVAPAGAAVKGSVHGGQQPVSGASVQLYAVGTTGDGSAPTALLNPAVVTDAAGGFTLTSLYTCPTPSTLVYVVATGGNPGLAAGTNNTALGEMAALGQCGSLGSATLIQVTEVTTVAAAAALAPYTAQPFNIGAGAADAAALAVAFQNASVFADTTTGTAPGAGQTATPGTFNTAVPAATINTLANILAGCVNTSGPGSAGCSQLFALTGNPTNTLGAIMNLQANPAQYNAASLFGLASATGPYQPQLTVAPANNFQVAIISPTGGSPLVFAFPATVSPGQTVWMVQKTYAPPNQPCVEGQYNYLRLNGSIYTTGGAVQCGVIRGSVPATVPYGSIYAEWLTSPNQQFSPFNSYSSYVNVVPRATPLFYFSLDSFVWEGTAGSASYAVDFQLQNVTGGALTLGTPTITGPNANAFNILPGSSCGPSITHAGGTCTITLGYTAPDTGFHYGTLMITATDAASKTYTATAELAGSGQY